jgi:hypothetical protein
LIERRRAVLLVDVLGGDALRVLIGRLRHVGHVVALETEAVGAAVAGELAADGVR